MQSGAGFQQYVGAGAREDKTLATALTDAGCRTRL